jgi:hypothetical protein
MVRAIIGGLIGGAIGAAIWAGIALIADREFGIIAWLVGGLVGFGVAVGSKGQGSAATGVLAAIIALGSISAGKFAVVSILVDQYARQNLGDGVVAEKLEHEFDDTAAKIYMAETLLTRADAEGTAYKWPEGKDRESAEAPDDYPKDLWKDVENRWAGMDGAAKEQYKTSAKAAIVQEIHDAVEATKAEAKSVGFLGSFSAFDLLWAFLAVGTAYRVGCQDD